MLAYKTIVNTGRSELGDGETFKDVTEQHKLRNAREVKTRLVVPGVGIGPINMIKQELQSTNMTPLQKSQHFLLERQTGFVADMFPIFFA